MRNFQRLFDRFAAPMAAALLLLLFTACGGDAPPPAASGSSDPAEVSFDSELGVDVAAMERTGSGLYIRDLEPGAGEAISPGQFAVVHYTGWLPSGQEFDSSRGGEPFRFRVGEGAVIQGWDEGVAGMNVGGRRQLVIPPDLAYGDAGAGGVIPPGAVLVFDVELLGIE